MKKILLPFLALVAIQCYAQDGRVGINTDVPKTTLDVAGKPSDVTYLDGLQAPRVTRAQLTAKTALYGADQKGAIIYVSDISGGDATGSRVNVTSVGYYYFDGTVWMNFSAGSATAGDTTDDAWVNNAASARVELGKTSTGASRATSAQVGISDSGKVGIGTTPLSTTELLIATEGGQGLQIRPFLTTDPTGSTRMQVRNNAAEVLNMGITNSAGSFGGTVPASTAFILTSGTSTNMVLGSDNTPKITLFANGNMGIGSIFPSQAATASLDVDGSVRVRSTPLVTDVVNKNMLMTDTSGNVVQIDSETFVSALEIPRVIFSAKDITTFTLGQSLTNRIQFSTVLSNGGNWNATNSDYTAPGDGVYQITGNIYFRPNNVANYADLRVRSSGLGGNQIVVLASLNNVSNTFDYNLNGATDLYLKAGDKIWLEVATCIAPGCGTGGSTTTSYTFKAPTLVTITRKTYQ